MTQCSFCYEPAVKFSVDTRRPIELYAYCEDHCSTDNRRDNLWLVDNEIEHEISESEYLLYLAMDTL
jgi:hypothetical protein